MNADGSGTAVAIAYADRDNLEPALSADGTKIAWIGDHDRGLDGGALHDGHRRHRTDESLPVRAERSHPDWRLDSLKLAFGQAGAAWDRPDEPRRHGPAAIRQRRRSELVAHRSALGVLHRSRWQRGDLQDHLRRHDRDSSRTTRRPTSSRTGACSPCPAATRGPRARRRCGSPWSPQTSPARRRTARTARRFASRRARRRSSPRAT